MSTVLDGYQRWNSGDFSGLTDLFTEDIVYQNAPEWPGQRAYQGASEVTSFLRDEVSEIIALRPVEILKAESVGSEIVIELDAHTSGLLSGLAFDGSTIYHVASIREGCICRVRVYLSREEAILAAETGEG